jgi:hypothetical protein
LVDRDAYAFLLVAIVVTLVLVGFGRSGGPVALAVQGATLLFALWTSQAQRRALVVALLLVLVAVVFAIVNVGQASGALDIVTASSGVLLAVGAMVAILRRAATRLRIDGETVYAVMSVYLLIGLSYAYVYGLIGAASNQPFFAGDHGTIQSSDFIYFSFITLTTVGYGDFTPAQRVGEMFAASEAVIGQLYLVSVVGLVVSRFGQPRRDRKQD